jgi:hypothetical protein
MKRTDRRTSIMRALEACRNALRYAAESRAEGQPAHAAADVERARFYLDHARTLMSFAPASTRRRWRNQAETNWRKRAARSGAVVLTRPVKGGCVGAAYAYLDKAGA